MARIRGSIERRRRRIGFLFITLWLAGLIIFYAYPLGYSFFMTFNEIFSAVGPEGPYLDWTFVGFGNYRYAFGEDPQFLTSMIIFLQESLLMIPVIVVFALLVSYLLSRKLPGRAGYRAVFFLPVIITGGGVILSILETGDVAAGGLDFLRSEQLTIYVENNLPANVAGAVVGVLERFSIILWYSGVQILILLAGYSAVSPTVYEAARIDGAGGWETFWKITLPSLVPFIMLNVVYTIVDQFTLPWNPILALTREHLTSARTGIGYAATVGWIYFIFTSVMIGLAFFVFRKRLPKTDRGGR
ncbi:MAG: carbohydrate ABC transporter permease [Spirochaetota bacterium]